MQKGTQVGYSLFAIFMPKAQREMRTPYLCVADDRNMVPAEHCLQMQVPDKARKQYTAYNLKHHTTQRS